jgi:hypothetical protein
MVLGILKSLVVLSIGEVARNIVGPIESVQERVVSIDTLKNQIPYNVKFVWIV